MKAWQIGIVAGILGAVLVNHRKFVEAAGQWRGAIDLAGKKYNINKHILASLIWTESRFNPAAVSSAGAVGLTQIRSVAAQDLNIVFSSIVNNPGLQIDAGAAFLRMQIDRSGGDLYTGLRSYNAGAAGAAQNAMLAAGYALEIMQGALVDWLYGLLSNY